MGVQYRKKKKKKDQEALNLGSMNADLSILGQREC